MDPKHVLRALAALYVEEHGGYVRVSKSLVAESLKQGRELVIVEEADGRILVMKK